MVNIHKIMLSIEKVMFNDLGVYPHATEFRMKDLEHWCRLGSYNISPRMCGPLAPMFASISVLVDVGYDPSRETLLVRYEYIYTHHDGGRNGHTVTKNVELV